MSAHQPIRVLGPQFAPSWHRPQFRYFAPVEGAEGTNNDDASKDGGADLGFPKETPVDQMTPEQRAAYWQNQSKVQQKARETAERSAKAYEKFGTVDELQSAADAAETARVAALDDHQKAIEAAKAEARAEALAEAGNGHLPDAVKGYLIALTKGANETFEAATSRVEGAIEFADLTKFVGENGALDAAKVQAFAQSLGSVDGNGSQSGAAWGDRFNSDHAGRIPPAPGSTGSVASMEQAAYDAMKPKTTA